MEAASERGPAHDGASRPPIVAAVRRRRGWPRAMPGPMPAGAVLLHAPVVRVPGAGRRREPARPDRPAPRSAGRPRPAVLALDRPARGGPAAPPLRDVARGARAGPGGAGAGVPVVLSPICWYRAPGDRGARAEPAAEGRRAWRRGACDALAPGLPVLAARAAPPGRRRSCPTRGPRPTSSSASSGSTADRIRVVPNGVAPRVRHGLARRLPRALRGRTTFVLYVGRIEPRKNVLGLIRAVRRLGLPLVVIGDAAAGPRGYAARLPARRRGPRRAGWAGSTTTTRCWPRPTRRPGSSPCRAGSRRPGLAALEAALAGCAVVDHALRLHPRVLRRPGRLRPARPARARSAARRRTCLGSRPRPPAGAARRHALPLAERGPEHGGGL